MTHPLPQRRTTAAAATALAAMLLVTVVGCRLADPDGQPEAVPSARAPLPATALPPVPSTSAPGSSDDLCDPAALLTPAEAQDLAGRTGGTAPTTLSASTPAAPALSLLSGAIGATSCDRPVNGAKYDFVQLRQWAADTTIQDGHATSSVVLFEEQRWRAADWSGRVVSTRFPGTRQPPAGPDNSDVRHQPCGVPPVLPVEAPTDQPCNPPPVLPGPIATDASQLAEQSNARQPRRMGPQSVLRAYADLATWHTTTVQIRHANLGVLANTDGLRYHPAVIDRAGRTGVGVSVDSNQGDTRDLVILHATTGQILAYEHAVLGNRTQRTTAPRVENYILYLAHATTASTDALPQ